MRRTISSMYTIHLVEDDPDIRKGLLLGLEQEGFLTQWNDDGSRVFNMVFNNPPHLMILDIRLPGLDGLSVCRQLRNHNYTFPIIMLTARDEEIDRITGLETGADDYLVKPFGFRELVSRIKAQIRRTYGEYQSKTDSPPNSNIPNLLPFGFYTLELRSMRLFKNYNSNTQEEIFLTPIEMKLLVFFLTNTEQTFNRDQIIRGVWGETIFLEDQRTVDVHIRHLREKIEPNPSDPDFIITVRGLGYRFQIKKS